MKANKVLVTGASGMVGFHTVKHLLAQGYETTALIRESSKDGALKSLAGPLSILRLSLDNEPGLLAALQGVDVLVHAAGLVDPHATKEEIYGVNVESCNHLLQAASQANLKHFIHISSLSVITGKNDLHGATEDSPILYSGEAYADSKIEAEKTVSLYFGRSPMMVTILRPGFIYGPMERAWMPRLIDNLKHRRAMLIDGGIKQTNVIFVDNLVTAIMLAMMNPKADKQVFNLTDGETVTKKELFDAICDGMGYKRIEKEVPGWLARAACESVSTLAPLLPAATRKNLSRFSRAAFRLAGLNQGFDISKAESVLGYKERIPFSEGMKSTLVYFKQLESTDSQKDKAAIK